MSIPAIDQIHLESKRLLKLGHPWITADSFSLRFPVKDKILEIKDGAKSLGFFLHDPLHPKVKARFWSPKIPELRKEISERLKIAFEKRNSLNLKRENYYLVFAEADLLPGLYIQKLADQVLIQYQAFFWQEQKDFLLKELKNAGFYNFWWQARLPGEQKIPPEAQSDLPSQFEIKEEGLKFILRMDDGHDIGIYTDMSAVRQGIAPLLPAHKKLLNLFSYTGAFTLLGLQKGMKVTSVDLSKKYMNWLEENIELNQFNRNLHSAKIMATDKFLQKNTESFDFIICDPPSFSSNKKKRESSFGFYEEYLKNLFEILTPEGQLLIFSNTHQLSRDKFKKLVSSILPQAKISREFGLKDDCPTLSQFSEGDYLKGLLLTKS